MISFYKKYWKTAFDIFLIVLTVYLIMLTFSWLYKIAAPIFLALIIFAIIEPLARFLHRRKIKKSVATAISILLFVLIILGAMTAAGIIFVTQINGFLGKLPGYTATLQHQITLQTQNLQEQVDNLPPNIAEKIPDLAKKTQEYSGVIAKRAAQFLTWGFTHLVGWLSSFSTFIINFFIAIVLAYFLSLEIELWKKMAREKTPNTFKTAFFFLREHVLKGIATYIKSQLKLISITFVLILLGLFILGVKNAFSISLLSAFFDLLPLLGVSTVFLPWIVYLLVVGNGQLALWLTILLGIVILVRQIMEPKITGDSLGVSAFTMLSFMIVSLSIFGVSGLILSPILIILIKALHDEGYLKRWVRLPEDEYETRD